MPEWGLYVVPRPPTRPTALEPQPGFWKMVRGHEPRWVRESAQLGSEPPMAEQVEALQLLSHIIKHEGQLMGPKSSLQIVHSLPSHAHPHNPTPPLYFQTRRRGKECW